MQGRLQDTQQKSYCIATNTPQTCAALNSFHSNDTDNYMQLSVVPLQGRSTLLLVYNLTAPIS